MLSQNTSQNQESASTHDNIYTPEDIEMNKTIAGLSYLLFFLPLIVCPNSKFARFHANQGLILLIAGIVGNLILGMIPIVGWLVLMPIFSICLLVLGVMGLINGLNGKAVPLPLIGKFTILK